ncbi:exonuclease SbcCD subunit D [soil metagenome]
MKLLHTADWHVGRTIRGRSRTDEHRAVLAEIAGIAATEEVDAVLVVGDLFDTATPTAETEQIVFRALLDLAATGAAVIVLAGNHDSDRRIQAVQPLLELGRVITRPVFVRPDDGGVTEVVSRNGGETAKIAAIPFLSQRYVVRAGDLMDHDAGEHGEQYDARVRRLIEQLTSGFGADTVNFVAAHLMVGGGRLGGGERMAHTIFDYEVGAAGFPATAHYVALGHLHRRQQIPGPCPIHYSGSPLPLDFGETGEIKAVVIVEAHPGSPAAVRDVALSSGRRLRTLAGTPEELSALVGTTGDDHLRLVVRSAPRIGLADGLRDQFPNCVDVIVERPDGDGAGTPVRPSRAGRAPGELFEQYLTEAQGQADPALIGLFAELLEDELATEGDASHPA